MSLAALEAGIALNNSSVTIVHGMSRPIGALFHVPHGLSNAMLLGTCLTYVVDGALKRFADLGRAAGAAREDDPDAAAAEKFLEELKKLLRGLGIPRLKEYGIDRSVFDANIGKMARDAFESGSPSNTRKQISTSDMEKIYTELWR
jgi:alcohol dehydrogenase class IV